mgnify:CR=1 FL=1
MGIRSKEHSFCDILLLYEIVEKVGEAHAVLGRNCELKSGCDIH